MLSRMSWIALSTTHKTLVTSTLLLYLCAPVFSCGFVFSGYHLLQNQQVKGDSLDNFGTEEIGHVHKQSDL